MNLYLRFFNQEVLVENVGQAINFLSQIPEIKLTDALCRDLTHYVDSSNLFPKRFKVSQKVYFIVIKTTAATMEEFKAYAVEVGTPAAEEKSENGKEALARALAEEKPGWYKATMKFKQVLPVEGTSKFRYQDSEFVAKLKAHSTQDCYNRVVDHLRTRADVDPRSQFPSIRGRKFEAEFLGMNP